MTILFIVSGINLLITFVVLLNVTETEIEVNKLEQYKLSKEKSYEPLWKIVVENNPDYLLSRRVLARYKRFNIKRRSKRK